MKKVETDIKKNTPHLLKRSKIRILLGRQFYNLKKLFYWNFSGVKFAGTQSTELLPNVVFEHRSLLLRELKKVEMWMQHNKVKNLRLAIRNLDGLLLRPGEVFSYWKLIGLPTSGKGFLPGMTLYNGEVRSGIGGGLCQLSNLIYWMTLHTPMTIVERWRHGFDVFPDSNRKLPFGSGATCSYPNIDLQFRNDTENTFQLRLEVTATHLVGSWMSIKPLDVSYAIVEKDHLMKLEWWGGYTRNNKLFRETFDKESGRKIAEELITENSAVMMYSPLLEKIDL